MPTLWWQHCGQPLNCVLIQSAPWVRTHKLPIFSLYWSLRLSLVLICQISREKGCPPWNREKAPIPGTETWGIYLQKQRLFSLQKEIKPINGHFQYFKYYIAVLLTTSSYYHVNERLYGTRFQLMLHLLKKNWQALLWNLKVLQTKLLWKKKVTQKLQPFIARLNNGYSRQES